ncbi:hypothetical protein OQA88_3275 [Cercophora sp. LCS_1]
MFDLGPAFGSVDGTPRSSTGPPSHVISALMGHPSSDLHLDGSETAAGGFGTPDAEHHLLGLQTPTTSLESLATLLAKAASSSSIPAVPFYDATATAPAPLMEMGADHQDTTSFLFLQLTAVSQRAMRTARCLARSGTGACASTLMVSSPEVNEALEDTNTLISTVNDIMTTAATAGRDDSMTTTDDAALAFSALACHQNLMTLFRAICDAIQGRLQAKKEEREQEQHVARDNSGVGPLNIAQFVMVLQLLMHLINRMGRFLMISHMTTEQESQFITPTTMLDCSTMSTEDYAIDTVPGLSTASTEATPAHHSTCRSGLLEHVQEIVRNIPSERERLRLMIQELQTDIDHAEIH